MEVRNILLQFLYRPEKDNIVADTFTRAYCSALSTNYLYELHSSLCHPGITRMTGHVRSRNLPFSVEDIRSMITGCKICQECKPRFYRPIPSTLIKATQPMERLNLDFKGPLSSCIENKFMLTASTSFPRYPFIGCTKDLSAATVVYSRCLRYQHMYILIKARHLWAKNSKAIFIQNG